ncbi:hypothetical protein KEM56_005356 [Ascosphaera pollenicola]|nr:hypothetical protein KEM56_005356 [Ascosphaera pollenicola]
MRSTSSILPLNGNNDEENGLGLHPRMSPIKRAVSSVLPGSSAGNHGRRNILPAASLERMILKIGEDGRATTEMRITASLDECEEDDGNETDSQGRHQGSGEEPLRGHTMSLDESALHVAEHPDDDDDVDAFDDDDDDEGNESDLLSDSEADYQHMLNPQFQGLGRRRKNAHGNESFARNAIDKLISSQIDDEIFAPGAMPDLAINGVRAAAVLTPKSRSKSRTFARSTSCFVPKATAASRNLTRSSSARAAPNDLRLEHIKLKIEGLAIEKKAEFDNTDLNEDESDDDNEIKTKEDEGKGQAQVELRELLARSRNQPCGPMVRPDRLGCPQPEGSKYTATDGHTSVGQVPSPCVSATSVKGRPSPTGTISSQSTRDSTPTPAPISQLMETIPQKIPPKPTAELATSGHSPTRTVPVDRAQTEKSRKIPPPTPGNLLNTPIRKKHTFVQYTPIPKGKGKGSKALTKQVQQPSPSPRNKTLKTPAITVSARKPSQIQQTQQQPPLPPSSPPLFPYSLPLGQAASALQFPPILPAPPSGPPPSSPTTVTDPELGTTTPLANSSFESVWSRTAGDHGKNENNAKPRERRRPSNPSNGTRCVCQSNEIGGHLMVKW